MTACTCEHAFDSECFKGDGKMTDLDKLIEAVEGGVDIYDMDNWAIVCAAFPMSPAEEDNGDYESDNTAYARYAYHGSLDAAKALHEALLPGFDYSIDKENGGYSVYIWKDLEAVSISSSEQSDSRAWLIAVLKAYRAQQETEQ